MNILKTVIELRKYLRLNKSDNTTYQIMWDEVKPLIQEKCIAVNSREKKRLRINELTTQKKYISPQNKKNTK